MLRVSNNIEFYESAKNNEILVIHRGVGKQFHFSCDDAGKVLIDHLRSHKGAIDESQFPARVRPILENLIKAKILTRETPPSNDDPGRTQLQCFEDWGLNSRAVQKKIEAAKVAVIGVGGSGGWITVQLAGMGVKNFLLIDPDVVEESNLVRQPYKRRQIGKPKVEAMKELLLEDWNDLVIETLQTFATEESNYSAWFGSYGYVFIAADWPTRAKAASLIGQKCCALQKTHFICGAYSGHMGALGLTVIPGKTPCWDCYCRSIEKHYHPILRENLLIHSGPRNPAGIFPSVLLGASASVLEFVKVVSGKPPTFSGKQVDLFLDWSLITTEFGAKEDCETCSEIEYVR